MKKIKMVVGMLAIMGLFVGCSQQGPSTTVDNGNVAVEQESKNEYTVTDVEVINNEFGTEIVGVVTNNTNREMGYLQVEFNCYDANGNRLDTAFDNVNNIKPGESWKFKAVYMGTEQNITVDTQNPTVTGW